MLGKHLQVKHACTKLISSKYLKFNDCDWMTQFLYNKDKKEEHCGESCIKVKTCEALFVTSEHTSFKFKA